MKQKLVEELNDVEKQLENVQYKKMALETILTELRIKSHSEEEQAIAKLEEQRLLKELHPVIQDVLSLQQKKDELDKQMCWVNALKYEIYKGIIW